MAEILEEMIDQGGGESCSAVEASLLKAMAVMSEQNQRLTLKNEALATKVKELEGAKVDLLYAGTSEVSDLRSRLMALEAELSTAGQFMVALGALCNSKGRSFESSDSANPAKKRPRLVLQEVEEEEDSCNGKEENNNNGILSTPHQGTPGTQTMVALNLQTQTMVALNSLKLPGGFPAPRVGPDPSASSACPVQAAQLTGTGVSSSHVLPKPIPVNRNKTFVFHGPAPGEGPGQRQDVVARLYHRDTDSDDDAENQGGSQDNDQDQDQPKDAWEWRGRGTGFGIVSRQVSRDEDDLQQDQDQDQDQDLNLELDLDQHQDQDQDQDQAQDLLEISHVSLVLSDTGSSKASSAGTGKHGNNHKWTWVECPRGCGFKTRDCKNAHLILTNHNKQCQFETGKTGKRGKKG